MPFARFIIAAFMVTGIEETTQHIPGLERTTVFRVNRFGLQAAMLGGVAVEFILLRYLSYRYAVCDFEKIDL